jgi:ElaB/YqjD/DUF883 family membrane-anchored ribosome-binding protein
MAGIRKDCRRQSTLDREEDEMAATTEKDLQKDLDALRADIQALSDTVGKLATEAAKTQASVAKSVRHAGEEIAAEARHLGKDAIDTAGDVAEFSLSAIEKEIKQNPVGAVLIALGIGFLVGIVGRR